MKDNMAKYLSTLISLPVLALVVGTFLGANTLTPFLDAVWSKVSSVFSADWYALISLAIGVFFLSAYPSAADAVTKRTNNWFGKAFLYAATALLALACVDVALGTQIAGTLYQAATTTFTAAASADVTSIAYILVVLAVLTWYPAILAEAQKQTEKALQFVFNTANSLVDALPFKNKAKA